MKPPLKARTSCSLLKVEIAFAAWAVSPRTKVSAVGPCSSSARRSSPALSAAILVSRFLTMRKLASASRSLRAQLGRLGDADAPVVDREDRLGRLDLGGDLLDCG